MRGLQTLVRCIIEANSYAHSIQDNSAGCDSRPLASVGRLLLGGLHLGRPAGPLPEATARSPGLPRGCNLAGVFRNP